MGLPGMGGIQLRSRLREEEGREEAALPPETHTVATNTKAVSSWSHQVPEPLGD